MALLLLRRKLFSDRQDIVQASCKHSMQRVFKKTTQYDRQARRNLTFQGQMPQMLAVYFRSWAEVELPIRPTTEDEEHAAMEEVYELTVVDMFGTF
jgi:hypothetical protein